MIKQEYFKRGNRDLVRTYSDIGFYIKQVETNYEYAEAIDIVPCKYNYIETNKLIEKEEQQKV